MFIFFIKEIRKKKKLFVPYNSQYSVDFSRKMDYTTSLVF